MAETFDRAVAGDVEAAEEVLDLFRSAVDSRQIDGQTARHRRIAEYIAQCFWAYAQGATIQQALRLEKSRGRGQPKGTRKVDESSYAAFLVLLRRQLGTASKAKDKVIELEQDVSGTATVSRRTLDTIFANYIGLRDFADDDLVVMMSRFHRKLFKKTLR